MKHVFALLLLASLGGCASQHAVVPALEGKPRVQINKPAQKEAAHDSSAIKTQGE